MYIERNEDIRKELHVTDLIKRSEKIIKKNLFKIQSSW